MEWLFFFRNVLSIWSDLWYIFKCSVWVLGLDYLKYNTLPLNFSYHPNISFDLKHFVQKSLIRHQIILYIYLQGYHLESIKDGDIILLHSNS